MLELIYPPNRIQALLASAAGEESWEPDYTTLEAPRIELYLRKINGEDVQLPEYPVTTIEKFLAYKCGEDVELPEPVTRLEMLLAKDTPVEPAELPEPQTMIEYYVLNMQAGGGGVEKTESGEAPLTIEALAHAIVSLTQNGKVTQASTPTPSSPVELVCNNGALKAVDDELPTGYKRVLGFTCDNNAMWQITGFKLKGSDTVRISFSVNASCNVFGCYQGADATDNYDLYASVSAGSKYLRYGNGTYLSYWSPDDLGQRFDVTYTPTGSQGMPQDSTWSALTFESANDLLLGSTTVAGTSAKLKGKLFGDFIVENGGVERLHLVPCERVSDNVLGYYDLVGEAFYEPYTGYAGAVSLGYDGSHYVLRTVGTPEVLWIDDGNKFPPNAVADVKYPVKGNGSMCIVSCDVNNGTNVSAVEVHYYKADGTQINYYTLSSYDDTTHRMYKSFSLSSMAAFVSIERKSAYSTATVTDLKLEIGSTLTPYVQPTGVASAQNLLSVGSYADTQEIIGGTVNRAVGVAVLTGDENVQTSNACYTVGIPDKVTSKATLLCSHFSYSSKTSSQTDDQTIISFASTNVGFRYDALRETKTTIIDRTISTAMTNLSADECTAVMALNNGDTVMLTVNGTPQTVSVIVDGTGNDKYWEIMNDSVDILVTADGNGFLTIYSDVNTVKVEATTTSAINATQFNSWLKEQYDAGTPVIVLYPLAEETTEQVTPQALRTAEGTNTVSVTSEVDPVTLTVVYKGTDDGGGSIGGDDDPGEVPFD